MARTVRGIRARRLAAVLMVTVTASLAAVGPVPMEPAAQTASPGGRIVYVKQDTAPGEHLNDIWVMDADGTNQTNLTNTPDTNEGDPAWSPDGTRIAFVAPGPKNIDGEAVGEIWVMDADGGNRTNLTNTTELSEFQPTWAPSGDRLAFVRSLPGETITDQPDIFVMDADGGRATNLTKSDESEYGPDWSPDGAKIAFAGVRNSGWEILTMDPDGSNEEILTGDGFDYDDEAPDWSPDGTMLVFMRQSQVGGCCEPWEIWAVNRDGSGDTNLTNHPRDDTFPSWSPDGSEITFSSNRDVTSGFGDIYAMPAPGSLPPSGETAAVTADQEGGVMRMVASYMLPRASSALAAREDGVRRLTRGGGTTAPDWGKGKTNNTSPKNTAPSITDLRPAKDATTADRTPAIGATVADAQTNLAKDALKLVVDGTRVPRARFSYDRATDRLRYTPEADLSVGDHTVKVVARDPDGLVARKTWSFSVSR